MTRTRFPLVTIALGIAAWGASASGEEPSGPAASSAPSSTSTVAPVSAQPTAPAAAVAASPASPAPAAATADAPGGSPGKPPKPLRDGVVLGLSMGFGLASAEGYPNDVRLDKNPDYYGSTPMLPGYSFSFMFMGALTPYLNVGVWGGGATFQNADWKSVGGGGGLRVEGFPLMAFCPCVMPPILANYLGVYGQVGVGSVSTRVKREGNYETVGGVQSFLAAGAFYEVKLGKLFAIGPDLRYEVITSRTSDRNSLILGARLAFYPAN